MNDMRQASLAAPKSSDSDAGNSERKRRHPRPSGPVGILDIGTTKIICMIGRCESDLSLRITGFGWERARGVRAGSVLDIEEAEQAIRAAVGTAEEEAGTRLRAVTVNLSAGAPESRLFNVQWPVGGRAVNESDIRQVVAEGRNRAESPGRSIIHALPLGFATDEAEGSDDPRGLFCETLGARLHVVDAVTTALRTLDATLARCDLEIASLVSAPLAAGMATLVEDERQLGVTLLDMGGGTTGMAVFAEGHLLHTAQLPVGGVHVTNDLARGLSTSVTNAERLKVLYGSASASPDDEREVVPVQLVGEDEGHIAQVPRSMIVDIIRPRIEETFELMRDRIAASGLGRVAGQTVVLTGGASQLPGIRETAARLLGRQVRLARPARLHGMPERAGGPGFATATGLFAWAAGEGRRLADIDFDADAPRGLIARLADFIRTRL